MGIVERFQEYAAAFEDTYKTDDWSILEPYFTEDAVYETLADPPFAAKHEGRDVVFTQLKQTLDTLDRRFSRELEVLEGPAERSGAVWLHWRVTYRAPDLPPLVMEGEETATFSGERIQRLEDRFSPGTSSGATQWLQEHGAKLGPVGG
jgi:hypothetical protein